MAHSITRLLPWREYNENDVVNIYSFDADSGEAGTLVKVAAGNLELDPVEYVTRNTANGGWAGYSHATSRYPEVPLKVTTAGATDTGNILGILLRDVRETDENGEKLLFYPEKREEMQCVVSGQAVPICGKGRFAVLVKGFTNSVAPNVGDFVLPSTNGTFTGVASATATVAQQSQQVGLVLGTGNRVSQQDTDEFAGAYAFLKLSV